MSPIPTRWEFRVKRYVPGAKDPLGNPVDTWADPVPLPAHGIQPGAMTEPGEPGRNADEVLWTILAPAGTQVGSRDKVLLPGMAEEFDVVGHLADFSMGPWPFDEAGVAVEVGHVEG